MCKLEGNVEFESRVLKVGRDIRERHGQGLGPICFFPKLRFAREYGSTDRRVLDWVGEVRATCLGNRSWNNARISPLSAGWSG